MNAAIRLLPIVCACIVAQALAASPQASPADTQSAAAPQSSSPATTASDAATKPSSSEKPSTTTAPAPKPASNKVVLVDKTLTDAQVKELLSRGYRPQARGDQVVYCRREAILGSRFESKVCSSAEQIFQAQQDSKELADRAQRGTGSPTGN